MKKSLIAVFAVVIIVIVVLAGALELGLLNINPSSSKTTVTVKNAYAPNVVASSDLNTSLGGSWSHESSGYGTSGNISSILGLLGVAGHANVAGNAEFSSAVSVPTPSQSVYGNITSFEFSIYSPNHAGFAGVAVANYKNQADVNATYSYIDAKIMPYQNATIKISKGNISNHNYIYAWYAVHSANLTPKNQNASLLIGSYKAQLIAIFYLTPTNLTQAKFASLYQSEINLLASQNNAPPKIVLVTGANLGNYIGGSWEATFGINVQINNASAIIHEFSGDLSYMTSSEKQIIYQIAGNLTGFAYQSYVKGTTNSTILEFAKFANGNVPYALYLDALSLYSTAPNATAGTVAGANYTYANFYYAKSMFNPNAYSTSILISDYKDYIIIGEYVGASNVSQSQFSNLLKAEVGLL